MSEELRAEIIRLARQYHESKGIPAFVPGETYIPPSGKVLDADDCAHLIDASLDMWLTAGRYANAFEAKLAARFSRKFSKLTVSGSAANLLAFTTLTSHKMRDRQILPGSEVITVAAGFPTTVNPIVQNRCLPVFVDIDIESHNVNVDLLEQAITDKTRAVMIAHSLGNPFDVARVAEICRAHNLFLIEDCCDAFGATVDGKQVGTFGDLATVSFYPAHHITMGEGGGVMMDQLMYAKVCESYRDWGRDCYCAPGMDNTCNNRFGWKLGDLPHGYDHKYIYSHIGYNLKVSDMQAAIGLSQLDKLDGFIAARNAHFDSLKARILAAGLGDYYHLPQVLPNAEPSWFGFLLTLRDGTGIDRNRLVAELERRKVGTRLLFAGNLVRQPAYRDVEYRVHGTLKNSDKVMADAFWIGVWPGLTSAHLDYMIEILDDVTRAMAEGRLS
jgi:CDP-6-deoxy-D-xylo-4-hexulose-3-dehydrase